MAQFAGKAATEMFWRGRAMYRRLSDDVRGAELTGIGNPNLVTPEDLGQLPAPAQRYLRAMGVVGRPRDGSFLAHFTGRFRLEVAGAWMPAEVWQYNSGPEVARIFLMRIDFAGLLPMLGRDTYLRGVGDMHGRLLGLATVARAHGWETDLGELVTYLNDATLLAPSMLLTPAVTFAPVDERSFDITLTDRGHVVTARVLLDGNDLPSNFTTTDRFIDLPGGLVRTRWETPVDGWQRDGGRPLFTRATARWDLPDGPLEYVSFTPAPGSVRYNVAPADISSVVPTSERKPSKSPL